MRGLNPAILASTSGGIALATNAWIRGGGGLYGQVSKDEPGEDPDWPDTFMSYPLQSTPISLYNVHGNAQNPYIIEELSFEGLNRPDQPISLESCSYITIRRIDSRKNAMGLVFGLNSNNITVEYCRAENIGWEFRDQYLLSQVDYDNTRWLYTEDKPLYNNSNDCNFYQFDHCSVIRTNHMKGRYGNTEDYFSHYGCDDVIMNDVHVEGATSTTQPTSDGSRSVKWTSMSGTGAIAGDEGGSDILIQNSTFLNSGQVGMQIAGGSDCTFDNCVSYNEGYGSEQWWNQPASTYAGTPPMTGHAITNCRTWGIADNARENDPYDGPDWGENHGWWEVTPDLTGTVLGDTSIDPEDLRVVL